MFSEKECRYTGYTGIYRGMEGWRDGYRDEYKERIEGGMEYKDDDKIEKQPIRSQPTRQQLDITTGGGNDSETMEMYRDLLPEREMVTKK